MNSYAEEFDSWNDATGVGIIDLDVRDLIVKRDVDKPGMAFIGRLFTMKIGMMSNQGGDIKASVTGYVRASAPIKQGHTWMAENCYAPRSHENGVPLVRLLERPDNLRENNGDRFTPLALCQRIAEQLGTSDDWRVEIASMVEPVTAQAIHDALGIPFEEEAPLVEDAPASEINLDFEDEADMAPQAHSADELESASAADTAQPDDQSDVEAITDIDLDAEDENYVPAEEVAREADEETEDVLSIVDQWDEEDASEVLDGLPSFDGQDGIDLDSDDGLDDTISEPSQTGAVTSDSRARVTEALSQAEGLAMPEVAIEEPERNDAIDANPKVTPEPAMATEHEVFESREHDRSETDSSTKDKNAERVMKETVLHNEDGYDIGFFGFEVGSLKLVSGGGDHGTLYRTKAGLSVVHIDGQMVKHFDDGDKDQLFEIMGFGREAKKLYAEAGVKCVKWLD